MIDSSPMYGSSQEVIGYGLRKLGMPPRVLSADKVWISSGSRGPAQIEDIAPALERAAIRSAAGPQPAVMAGASATLFAMKAAGRLRYVGITTSEGRRHREFEQIMRSQPLDFIQVTYNVLDRDVEDRILPLARERGMGVIVNRPFRQGCADRLDRTPPAARLGCRNRLCELGAAAPEVHRRRIRR